MSWNSARTDRWIYRSLAVLFTVAAVLRLTLDGTVGAVALGVAGGALLAVIPWLGVRWLMPRLLRKTTEDKIVRDFRSYLSNAPQEDTQPVPIPCDFRVAAMIPPQVPDAELAVVDALPPRSRDYASTVLFNWPHAA